VGKSTFLKTILGKLPLLDGRMTRGSDLSIGVYSQLHEELVREETVYRNFERYGLLYTREKVAAVLSNYGLGYEHVDMVVKSLSGGQTSKLLFAMLGCVPSNLLILDEPTNHLDAESREALETALEKYPGTLLFISHDRYFVNKIAKKLWVIEAAELRVSYGNYDDYRQKKAFGLPYDTILINDEGEMDLLLEEKLGPAEAKRIKEKYSRRKKR
jgi:ATP-binding cassette, subfamily F, member 3